MTYRYPYEPCLYSGLLGHYGTLEEGGQSLPPAKFNEESDCSLAKISIG